MIDPKVLDQVYRAILDELTLEQHHFEALLQRGFIPNEITAHGYKSLGHKGREELANKLVKQFGEKTLAQVPGFLKDKKSGEWTILGAPGLLIPVLQFGKILSLMVRLDKSIKKLKYSYLSSKKQGGPGPKAECHLPLGAPATVATVRLTEGVLKADFATFLGDIYTIAIPGVNCWRKFRQIIQKLDVKVVHISYDMDCYSNPTVAKALANTVKMLTDLGTGIVIESWDPKFKGIDDALLAKTPIHEHQGDGVQKFLDNLLNDQAHAMGTAQPPPPNSTESTPKFKQLLELGDKCKALHQLLAKSRNGVPMSHHERFRLAQIAVGVGLTDEEAIDLFRHRIDFNEEITRSQVQSIRAGYKRPDCGKLSEDLSFCSGTCQAKERAKVSSPVDLLIPLDPNNLPTIIVTNRQMTNIVDDTNAAIQKANKPAPVIFLRGKNLIRIRHVEGKPELEIMNQDMVYGHIARVAIWMKINKQNAMVNCFPSPTIAKDLIATPVTDLPILEAVVSTPTFGKSGLITITGYHAKDHIFFDPKGLTLLKSVPENPSSEQINAAKLLFVDELLVDFPFSSDSDRAHALAAILLPFSRKLILGPTPMYGIEAPIQGAGKGLLLKIISLITTGRSAEIRTLPNDDDAIRKMLTAELSRGLPIIALDNIPSQILDSPSLAAMLTADVWTDRILGHSQMISCPNKALWLMTANNPRLSGEIARRYIRIGIDPKQDKPWFRTGFKHPNLGKWVQDNRAELVYAALVLIQAWLVQGQPESKAVLGSFEDWAAKMGGILEVAKVPGFLGNLNSVYEAADTDGEDWREFFRAWWARFKNSPQKVSELNSFCESHELLLKIRGPGLEKSQQTLLGTALQKTVGRVYDQYRLILDNDKGKHGKLYRLERPEITETDSTARGPITGSPEGPHVGPPDDSSVNSNSNKENGDHGDLKEGTQHEKIHEQQTPVSGEDPLQGPQGTQSSVTHGNKKDFNGGPRSSGAPQGSPTSSSQAGQTKSATDSTLISQEDYDAI